MGSRMLTSTASGFSENLSQQSPLECLCASGSKQTSREQNVHTLHGNLENGPRRGALIGVGSCAAHAASHSCHVAYFLPIPQRTPSPS